MTRTLIKIKRQ